jgi:hypothetical protein
VGGCAAGSGGCRPSVRHAPLEWVERWLGSQAARFCGEAVSGRPTPQRSKQVGVGQFKPSVARRSC